MPTFDVAQAVIGLFVPIIFLFGGLFNPPTLMPPGTHWIYVIDPVGYAFSAIIAPQFFCDSNVATCPSISVITPAGTYSVPTYNYVANLYSIDFNNRWNNVGYLTIFVLVFQYYNIIYQLK